MIRFITLFIFISFIGIPMSGSTQTNTQNPADSKKTNVVPLILSSDSTTKTKGGAQIKDQGKGKPTQQVVLKKPDSLKLKAREYFMSAGKKAQDKDYQGAMIDYRKSLKYNKSAVTYTKLAYACFLAREYDSAIVNSKAAIRMLPKNFEAYTILGVSYYENQKLEDALQTLQKACELNPTNPDPMIYNYLAAIKFLQKDYKTAVLYYDSVVVRDSTFQDVFSNRGMMHHYLGNYKDAINDYSMAIKMDSTDATAYNNRAAAKIILKEFPSALEDLDKAVRLNPKYSNAFENRGKVKLQMGDKAGACADWTISLSMGLETSKELIIKNCK